MKHLIAFLSALLLVGAVSAQQSSGPSLPKDELIKQEQQRVVQQPYNNAPVWKAVRGSVEGYASIPAPEAGVLIQGRMTLPCHAKLLEPQPEIPPREPPIRFRKNVPDCWISLELIEGKNRQVRRMTAAVGHPTLRLLRTRIGRLTLGDLPAGGWRILSPQERILAAGDDDRSGKNNRTRR